ncbi:nickel ABC transporter permease subunit NikC [Helicobacter baculiformis]|uniref:Nickel ABC transporter permease subunit NikC n=1 Tax=Helicobacter baculiformis TaxID=427351 RepID=A0ABV7ZFZ9_9HELI|nr:nickel ABC transporter permease subunit NikC [Helicobacter baculiformis]
MQKIPIFLAFSILIIVLVLAIFAPHLTPHKPEEIDLLAKFLPISKEHLLGTDHLGRDIFSRLIYGARISLSCVFLTLMLIILVGSLVGSVSGFMGGRVDQALMRLCDLFFAMPTIVLSLFLVGLLGTGLSNIIIAIALTHWAWYARIVRSIVLNLKNKEYVLVSKMCGASGFENFKKNMLKPILAQCIIVATLDIGHVMLHIAGLSFLGLGVKAPTPEWGIMISDAKDFLFTYPELIYYPGGALFLCVMSFNIIGDYLRDKLDCSEVVHENEEPKR